VGPRAGLDDLEKRKFLTLLGLEFRPLTQSLYRLRYPGSPGRCREEKNLFPLLEIQPRLFIRLACNPITIQTEIFICLYKVIKL
jgi:hypothetical protein